MSCASLGNECSGWEEETWRCAFDDNQGTAGMWVAQVCSNMSWVTTGVNPRDCRLCCGARTPACPAIA